MPTKRLPSLRAVRSFVVAARLNSFTAAARELNVTQGAVSRMVQTLEQELGVQLFKRNGRFLSLTPAGRLYQQEVGRALEQIATAGKKVREESRHEPLAVIVNAGFATRWLVPRLARFQQRHPTVHVDILASEADESVYGDRAQVTIRYGATPWPGKICHRLAVGSLIGVVCSPELKAAKRMEHPRDLLDEPLLAYTGTAPDRWDDYFSQFGLQSPKLGGGPRFYQLLMLAEAAMSGMGFALVPLALFEDELRSGRLTKAVPQTVVSKSGYFITHESGAERDPKVRAFKVWLLKEAEHSAQNVESRWA